MVRVMSYNIRFDNPHDGVNAWTHRRDCVCDLIARNEVDLVGIQEALVGQLRDIVRRLPGYAWLGTGREGGARGEHCPLLYREATLRPLRDGTFWLSETPTEVGLPGWDAALPRIVTWACFEHLPTGASFFAFSTHFDHKGEVARREGAALLASKVAEFAAAYPAVVMGDFNVEEDSETYRFLVSEWSDAYHAAERGHHGPDATFYWGDGFRAKGRGSRIDYIFVKGATTRRHEIIIDSRDGRHPSDHLPVLSEVELPLPVPEPGRG